MNPAQSERTPKSHRTCSYDAFDAIDIDGREWTKKKLEGNVVLLEFWSNWCGPCVSEIPYLRDAYERLKPQGFEIIGINRNLGTPEQQKLWLTTHGVAWPQIADAQGKQGPIADAFGVEGIPKSVLIDRQGRVVGVNLRGPRLTEKVSELLDAARQASGTDRRYERQKFGPDGEGSGGAAGVSVSIRD